MTSTYDALSWACVGLIALDLIGMFAMVIAFYLKCPHCGSWRGSYEPPPPPIEPGLLAQDDPRTVGA